jgi:hypothetical protein
MLPFDTGFAEAARSEPLAIHPGGPRPTDGYMFREARAATPAGRTSRREPPTFRPANSPDADSARDLG